MNFEFPSISVVALQQRLQTKEEELGRLQQDNGRLGNLVNNQQQTIEELKRQLKELKCLEDGKANEAKLDLIQSKQELNKTREALQGQLIQKA